MSNEQDQVVARPMAMSAPSVPSRTMASTFMDVAVPHACARSHRRCRGGSGLH